jgi:hypothetical protein
MTEFVDNPRRAPRALIECAARVQRSGRPAVEGPVVDYGPTGCQLVTPAPLAPEESVVLELRHPDAPEPVVLRGQVMWTAPEEPYRSGVKFEPASYDPAALFYGILAAAHPELVEVENVPDRLPLAARLVPHHDPDEEDAAVLPVEREVLLAVGAGASVGELRERLGARWEGSINALFALLARRLLAIEE